MTVNNYILSYVLKRKKILAMLFYEPCAGTQVAPLLGLNSSAAGEISEEQPSSETHSKHVVHGGDNKSIAFS